MTVFLPSLILTNSFIYSSLQVIERVPDLESENWGFESWDTAPALAGRLWAGIITPLSSTGLFTCKGGLGITSTIMKNERENGSEWAFQRWRWLFFQLYWGVTDKIVTFQVYDAMNWYTYTLYERILSTTPICQVGVIDFKLHRHFSEQLNKRPSTIHMENKSYSQENSENKNSAGKKRDWVSKKYFKSAIIKTVWSWSRAMWAGQWERMKRNQARSTRLAQLLERATLDLSYEFQPHAGCGVYLEKKKKSSPKEVKLKIYIIRIKVPFQTNGEATAYSTDSTEKLAKFWRKWN